MFCLAVIPFSGLTARSGLTALPILVALLIVVLHLALRGQRVELHDVRAFQKSLIPFTD